jgi:isoleucyl-tRNA synthetase
MQLYRCMEWFDWKMGYWIWKIHMWLINLNIWKRFGWLLKQIYNKDLMCTKAVPFNLILKSRNRVEFAWVNHQPGSYSDVTDTTVVAQFKVLGRQETIMFEVLWLSVQNLQHYKLSVLDLDEFYFLAWRQRRGLCHHQIQLWL